MSNTAAGFLLDDAVYKNIKEGWNAKLRASSQELSGLVPFVELYAVFASNDVIFKKPMLFSQVAGRAIDIKFSYTTGSTSDSAMDFQERFDIPVQAKIIPIASTAKAQTEYDTLNGSSFQGAAGINDLSVSRGASGPMNIKYDLNLTMPNPEVINEMYEYSKLMILNSKFLLVYGWNPHGFEGPYIRTPPPRLVNVFGAPGVPAPPNVVELNHSNGGFYKSTLVTLNRFNFSLDNVGHMSGKLAFLTLAGNFLSATRAESVSTNMKKQLQGYAGMLFMAGSVGEPGLADEGAAQIQAVEDEIDWVTDSLEESEAYAFAWFADMERRKRAFLGSNTPTTPYHGDDGPPFLSTDKFRVTQSDTVDGGNYQKFDLGKGVGEDNFRHPRMVTPTGRYGAERRVNPFADHSDQGEFMRYKRFKGEVLVPGINVPYEWESGRDPMTFEDDPDWNAFRKMRDKGIGYSDDKGYPKNPPAFRDAVVPKRIKFPQDITDARILDSPVLAQDAAAAKKIWESDPGHADFAVDCHYVSKEVEVMDDVLRKHIEKIEAGK